MKKQYIEFSLMNEPSCSFETETCYSSNVVTITMRDHDGERETSVVETVLDYSETKELIRVLQNSIPAEEL